MHEEKPDNIEILASTLIHKGVDQNIVKMLQKKKTEDNENMKKV
jgi:hypothetical protein